MLKKNQPLQFKRPMSSMRLVLSSIEDGNCSIHSIMDATRLKKGQVTAAIANLGAICTKQRDINGRAIYVLPGQIGEISQCLKGISTIFGVITTMENIHDSPTPD